MKRITQLAALLTALLMAAICAAGTITIPAGGNVAAGVTSARAGDVVKINDASFDRLNEIRVPSGVTITFATTREGPMLKTDNGTRGVFLIPNGARDITITGLKFDGPAVFNEGVSTNVKVTWNTIENAARGKDTGYGSGLAIGNPYGVMYRWDVSHNVLRNSSWGLGTHQAYDTTIWSWNEFRNVANPMKSNNAGAGTSWFYVLSNYVTGWSRMVTEFQGQAQHVFILDNFFEHPKGSTIFKDNDSWFVMSNIYHGDSTEDVNVLRNTCVIQENERQDGTGPRLFDEGGSGHIARDNYVEGPGTVFAAFMGDSSGPRPEPTIRPSIFENNLVIRAKWGVGGSYGPFASKATFRNNDANVKLSWDRSRGRPRRDGTWENGATPDPTTQPVPIPVPTTTPIPEPTDGGAYITDLTKSQNAWGKMELNRSNGEAGDADGAPITMNGKRYSRGIGMHADDLKWVKPGDTSDKAKGTRMYVWLDGKAARIRGTFGVDDEEAGQGSVVYAIMSENGNELWRSQTLRGFGQPVDADVDVTGLSGVFIYCYDAGDGMSSDHGDAAFLRVIPAAVQPIPDPTTNPTTQPAGDDVDITTTTKIRGGKHISTDHATKKAA